MVNVLNTGSQKARRAEREIEGVEVIDLRSLSPIRL
jgi:pyruvate/2-oxoglutarate/acetoin dehydrogenase E1 component